MSKEFRIERETDLPATPEQVWDAVTRDTEAWLMPGQASEDEKKVWDPPHHYIVRQEAEGWFNQLDMTIESRENGSFLRYVHSGILGGDWETQYDGASKHTDFYLHTLGDSLQHFDGRPFTHVEVRGTQASGPDALDVATAALGIAPNAAVGDSLQLTLPGAGPVEAVIDYRNQYFLGLRTADTLYRFFGRNNFGDVVAIGIHDFSGTDERASRTSAWGAWFSEVFV